MPSTALMSLTSLLTYLGFRLCYLATAPVAGNQQSVDNTTARHLRTIALPWIFFAFELAILLPNAMPYVLRVLAIKPVHRATLRLKGEDVPNIDILLTTCNENVNVVMDTVRAPCNPDNPSDRYRVFVCDDGSSKTLQAAGHGNLHYTARVKGPLKDFKAGNLNHGLKVSGLLRPLCVRMFDTDGTSM